MPNQISQIQKEKQYRFYLYNETRVVKFREKESRMGITNNWRKRKLGTSCVTGTELQNGMKRFWI